MNVANAVPLLDEAGKACRCSSSERHIAWQEQDSTSADHCTKHGDAANSNVASRCSHHFFSIECVRGYIDDTFRPCAQLVRCSMQESYASISMRYARRLGASPSMRIDLTRCRVPTTAMHGLTLDSHACVRQRAVVALAFVFPFAASMNGVYIPIISLLASCASSVRLSVPSTSWSRRVGAFNLLHQAKQEALTIRGIHKTTRVRWVSMCRVAFSSSEDF